MQVEASAARASQGRQASSLYLMTWVAVAAFGLGYIGVATTRPEILGAILPLAEPQQEQATAGRQANDLADEIVSLRKWIHELQHELAATKSTLQEQVAHSSSIVQRLAAAEERLVTLREVREPATKLPPPKVQTRAQAPVPAPAQAASAEQTQKTAQSWAPENPTNSNVRVLNTAAAPIATGSVPDPGATPGSPPARAPQAAATPRAIEIGSADSIDDLRSKWGEIAGRNGAVLGAASPRYRLSADGRPQPFTLLAGPFETPADATRACNALRAKGVACRVGGAFAGNAL